MLLHYKYGQKEYTILLNWTDELGHSKVCHNIVYSLESTHGTQFKKFYLPATGIDVQVDNLYRLIQLYNNEYRAFPYNPSSRRKFITMFKVISDLIAELSESMWSKEMETLASLYDQVLEKLRELTDIYLVDTSYQGKIYYRRRKYEECAETIAEGKMSYEFEDGLLQMTEISNALGRLTEKERRRFVKHIFLKYTLQEIADQENVRKQSIEESVSAGLKKLRSHLCD